MNEKILTSASIKYLIAIYRLDPEFNGLHCIELSKSLNVSKSSVHSMSEFLIKAGLIEKQKYGTVSLTDKGKEISLKYYYCNKYFTDSFIKEHNINIDLSPFISSLLSELSEAKLNEIYENYKI